MSDWYFADANGRTQGPVDAATLRRELGRRTITWDTQVWRDGMSEWRPLSKLADALGLEPPAAQTPPPLQGGAPSPKPGSAIGHEGMNLYAMGTPLTPPTAAVSAPSVDKFGRPIEDANAIRDDAPVIPAGFIRRLSAWVVDILLLSLIGALLMTVWTLWVGRRVQTNMQILDPEGAMLALRNFLLMPLFALTAIRAHYFAWFHSRHGSTLGQMLTGIRVVDGDGNDLSYTHALGRWFASALSWITLGVGFLVCAFPPRKVAVQDIVSGTQVVDRWAYTNTPDWQSPRPSWIAWAIAGIAVVGSVLLVNGSLGSYEQTRIRQGVMAGMIAAAPLQAQVDALYQQTGRCPVNGTDGLGEPSTFAEGPVREIRFGEGAEAGSCNILVRLAKGVRSGDLPEVKLQRSPADGSWGCSTNLPAKYVPKDCASP